LTRGQTVQREGGGFCARPSSLWGKTRGTQKKKKKTKGIVHNIGRDSTLCGGGCKTNRKWGIWTLGGYVFVTYGQTGVGVVREDKKGEGQIAKGQPHIWELGSMVKESGPQNKGGRLKRERDLPTKGGKK